MYYNFRTRSVCHQIYRVPYIRTPMHKRDNSYQIINLRLNSVRATRVGGTHFMHKFNYFLGTFFSDINIKPKLYVS